MRSYLMDERIRQLPKPLWKYLLRHHILPKRKNTSAARYRFIWMEEGSPLVVNQQRLTEKVQALFDGGHDAQPGARAESGKRIVVRSAMSYGAPSLEGVLRDLRDAGTERIVLLPLYPQSAYSPTLAVVDAFLRAQDAIDWHPPATIIDNYHDDPAYIAAFARAVRSVGFDPAAGDRLICSFHAIPLKDEAAGDTYRTQIAESMELVACELGIDSDDITVSFQSVFGHDPSKWTAPLTREILNNWRSGDDQRFA